MQLLNALFILATASLAAAAPGPRPPPKTLPSGLTWQLTGYGNPNCQGVVVWVEEGSSPGIPDHDCRATRLLAASYRWIVSERTRIRTWPAHNACAKRGPDIDPIEKLVAVGGDGNGGMGDEGCVTEAVYSIGIAQREDL